MNDRRDISKSDFKPISTQSMSSSVLKFLRTLSEDKIDKFQRSKLYLAAFNIGEPELRELDLRALTLIRQVDKENIEFSGTTRFTDLSTRKYDNFDSLIANSSNEKEPESLFLVWKTFDLDRNGVATYTNIDISFVTEKNLQNEELGPGDLFRSTMKITVSSSQEHWVDHAYMTLSPFIQAAQVAKFYRWMNVFRNRWFVSGVQYFASWIGFLSGMILTSKWLKSYNSASYIQTERYILSPGNLDQRFNRFVTYYIEPSSFPWWQPFMPIAAGGLCYGVLYFTLMKLLPNLAPRSTIAIGLSGKAIKDGRNLIRFIFVDILIVAIIIPIVLAFLKLT